MKNKMKKSFIIKLFIVLGYAYILFYLTLPAINLKNPGFYTYILAVIIVQTILFVPDLFSIGGNKIEFKKGFKNIGLRMGIGLGILVLIILINIINAPFFSSKAYAKRIEVNKENSFIDDIKQINFKALPLLDKDSSQKLGDRVMGQIPELVSQFSVSDLYTQINYNDQIIRVTPLEYASWIKYFTNSKEGIKGYITVDSVSGESKLVKLNKGMKIMPSAMFSKDLYRYLRFTYPTLIFDKETFEIDNEGNPYWVVPIINYAGIGLRKDISGVIVLNPITGSTEKYDKKTIPSWIDHFYNPNLIIEQIDDWGLYQSGFLNSVFGQKGVVQTTEGYNYTVMNDDVYMYTGITSSASDESNLGFVLTNLRTKETNFYAVPGAEEYSAMASAEGQVQQMNYRASFPLLINLNNRPTYLISLKDAAGLVKMYAFVDVVDYQKVVVSEASFGIEKAAEKYLSSFTPNTDNAEVSYRDIKITSIKSAIIDGNTVYYFTDVENQKYKVSLKINERILPFLKVSDLVKVGYNYEKELIEVVEISYEEE